MHQGDYIKGRLKEAKITQESLAKAIGVSRAQIIKVLSKRKVEEDTIGTLGKIMSFLNINYSDLPIVDDKTSHVDDNSSRNENYFREKIEQLERLLAKEEKLNQILERANDQLSAENKRLQSQLDQLSKKRDQRLEDGGSTVPTRRN